MFRSSQFNREASRLWQQRHDLKRFSVFGNSLSVLAGFCGLLLLMAALIIDSTLQIRDVTLDTSRLRRQSIERDALLHDLRTNLFHASTLARDHLYAAHDTASGNSGLALEDIRVPTGDILARYEQLIPLDEGGRFQGISAAIDS
jgi:hypothetical protein